MGRDGMKWDEVEWNEMKLDEIRSDRPSCLHLGCQLRMLSELDGAVLVNPTAIAMGRGADKVTKQH